MNEAVLAVSEVISVLLVLLILCLVVLLVILLILVLVVILLIVLLILVVFHCEILSLKFLNARFVFIMHPQHTLILIDKNFSYDKIIVVI